MALVLLAPLATAAAPDTGEDPEALIKQGNELRRRGENDRAGGYFKRAYQLARTPRTAAQLGLSELALSEFEAANAHLTEAIDADDAWVKARLTTFDSARATARKHLVRVELAGAPPDATVSVDARAARKLPADGVLWLAPGASVLRVEAPGRKPATAQVSAREGERRQVALDLPSVESPVPPPAPAAPPPAEAVTAPATATASAPAAGSTASPLPAGLRWTGVGVAAAGVVACVVGAIDLKNGNDKRDAIEAEAGTKPYDPTNGDYRSLQSKGEAWLVGGGVAVAAGLASFVVGSVLGARGASETAVSFSGGAGFGAVAWGGRF